MDGSICKLFKKTNIPYVEFYEENSFTIINLLKMVNSKKEIRAASAKPCAGFNPIFTMEKWTTDSINSLKRPLPKEEKVISRE